MQQLLTDENFPYPNVKLLRAAGYDVKAIQEVSPSIPDIQVLALAVAEARILLTFDSDYGELIYRWQQPAPLAVLYFRQGPYSTAELTTSVIQLLAEPSASVLGQFIILTPQTIRRKPLP